MTATKLIAAILVGAAVFMTYVLITKMMAEKRRKDSLRSRITSDGTPAAEEPEEAIALDRELSPLAQRLASILALTGMWKDQDVKTLELRFARAGKMSPDAPVFYVFFQRIVSILLVLLALVMFASAAAQGADQEMFIGAGILLIGIGVFGPHLYLENLIARRKKTLTRAFPDTLDLLLICVESGLALDASLNRVCSELGRSYPEMTQELNRTRIELALLNDRVKALNHLAERTDLLPFRSLTSSLIQSERLGTSLTDTLRVLSEEFRLERLSKAEEKAARLPVLLTIPLVLLLLPAFILIVLGPAIISFMKQGSVLSGG
jgi:tight adherence protein C